MQTNDDTNKEFIIKLAVCRIKMQDNVSSFALLQGDLNGSNSAKQNGAAKNDKIAHALNLTRRDHLSDLLDSNSDDEKTSPTYRTSNDLMPDLATSDALSHVNGIRHRAPSASSSSRQTITRMRTPVISGQELISESDSDVSDQNEKKNIPGEYDPDSFINLDVSNEVKDLFQYIIKYIPQNLNLDFKFKPFIPDYIPAVGDIDAFLKVDQPQLDGNNDKCDIDQLQLGLAVLDEPSAIQSDPALLHLKLRVSSVNISHTTDMVVKKVGNVEKDLKIIDKWIKDITDLHRSKPSPIVKYSNPMPDMDDLMQAWPENMENSLKTHGFPNYQSCPKLNQYIDIVCCLFDIPLYKNKIQSLHLFFSLYAVIKNSQLYSNVSEAQENQIGMKTDQLVLE